MHGMKFRSQFEFEDTPFRFYKFVSKHESLLLYHAILNWGFVDLFFYEDHEVEHLHIGKSTVNIL